MDLIRKHFDNFYDKIKQPIFRLTERDPEIAHNVFTLFCQFLYYSGLDKLVLDCKENKLDPGFKIYSAAGFNKDGKIPPRVMKYFGFDGTVYGTISARKWKGNKRPRLAREVMLESLSNYMGWNSQGCEKISKRNLRYGNSGIPVIISVGATNDPALKDDLEARLSDVEKTILTFRDNPYVIEFDFNPSCSNLNISIEQFQEETSEFGKLMKSLVYSYQKIGIKVPPDIIGSEIDNLIKVTYEFADKYITCNTTNDIELLKKYNLFNKLLKHPEKGVGSGRIVYEKSLNVQKGFFDRLRGTDKAIAACGGIDSIEKALERVEYEPQEEKEIRLLTPLSFRGTRLLRELRGG